MASKRLSENKVVVSSGTAKKSSARATTTRRATRSAKRVEPLETPSAELETATPVAAAPGAENPAPEAIAALAYSYWAARGCAGGSPEEDWLRAEQELRAAYATA